MTTPTESTKTSEATETDHAEADHTIEDGRRRIVIVGGVAGSAIAGPGNRVIGGLVGGAIGAVAGNAKVELNHVPFKGNADLQQALLGGHVMAQSDATGWDKFVDGGQMRLLLTFGDKRTKRWPNVPTLDELGYKTVSDSPFGVCGPKGMEPALTRRLHDAFRKTLEDPAVLAIFEKFDQTVIYMGTEQYTKWARETFQAERATIERLGMLAPKT